MGWIIAIISFCVGLVFSYLALYIPVWMILHDGGYGNGNYDKGSSVMSWFFLPTFFIIMAIAGVFFVNAYYYAKEEIEEIIKKLRG